MADITVVDHHRHVLGRGSPPQRVHREVLAESYESLTWKQNITLQLFETEVFDPLPNVDQMPAGFRYECVLGS